jgi:hypothetical protein
MLFAFLLTLCSVGEEIGETLEVVGEVGRRLRQTFQKAKGHPK